MNNFSKRALTGTAFVAVMVGCICWSYWSMVALFLTIIVLGLWEFYALVESANIQPQKLFGTICGSLIFILYCLQDMLYLTAFELAIPLTIFMGFFIELFRKKEHPFSNIAYTLMGLIYVLLPLLLLSYQGIKPIGPFENTYTSHIILGFFFLVWANDTFAYLTGRLIGKHKLFERISPKKTWEGTIGGLLLTVVVGYIISLYFIELTIKDWIIVAIIISVTGTLGDLVESMLKRSLNVKDSGNILPGHGGILDRFDGALLSSPFVFTYLLIVH